MFESEAFPGQFETDILAFTDPRTHMNGVRVLCADGSFELDEEIKVFEDHSEYNLLRHTLGIAESGGELGG